MVNIVFLIDDDEDDREIFRDAIRICNSQIEVLFARDGVEALELLRSSWVRPEIIFLDYNMPRMNGVECLKQLKASQDLNEIPVVMYTTSGDRGQENAILEMGADYYMRKTHSFEQLCTELARLLDDIAKNHPKVVVRRRDSGSDRDRR